MINGQVVRDGSTGDRVPRIERFIAYVSTVCPLAPGDILSTGTPSGVGFSRKPPLWLEVGDVCEVSITGIGTLTNTVARLRHPLQAVERLPASLPRIDALDQ